MAATPGGVAGIDAVLTLIGALIGAVASLVAVFARERYVRFRDRTSLAAALLAEVELLLVAVADERMVYGRLDKLFRTLPEDAENPTLLKLLEVQKGALDYRVSVYEKCAPQQIGQLDVEIATGLVRFFYFIDWMRENARPILFNPQFPREVREGTLQYMLNQHLPKEIQEGRNLQQRLEAVATWRFRDYARARFRAAWRGL